MELGQRDKALAANAKKTEAFDGWMAKPEIKMLVSLLPPLETDTHRDCFAALLRSAFQEGHDAGAGANAASMIESLLTMKERHDERRRS